MAVYSRSARPRTSPVNRVPAAILRSRLHRLLSGQRLLLGFTGRRTGTRYATPVNYLQRGPELMITTDSNWWRNLDGAARVDVVLRGRRCRGRGEPVHDPEVAAEVLAALIRHHPPYRRWAHVRLDRHGEPDPDDVRAEIARGRVPIRIVLDDFPA